MVDAVVGPWFLDVFLAEIECPVSYAILRPTEQETMRRATSRDGIALVDREVISHMFGAFSDLADHEKFVVDTTTMTLEETTATVREMLSDERFLIGQRRSL